MRHAEEALGPRGVDRHPEQGFERRAVDPFPAERPVVAHGESAVIERGVHHAGELQAVEDLRQDGRHAETPPAEDLRPHVEDRG